MQRKVQHKYFKSDRFASKALNEKMNLVLLTFVAAICSRITRSQLLSFPVNTAVKLGERVEFECRTNLTIPVRWEFAAVYSSRYDKIYLNEEITSNFSSRYKVKASVKERWTLVIDSVDKFHAGAYRCNTTPNYSAGEKEESVTAQLIVIDSDPVCNTNTSALKVNIVEGDYIHMWCSVNYSGNWIPVMDWTKSNGQTIDADILYTNTSTTVTSSLTTRLTSSDNGVNFTCNTSVKPLTTSNRTMKPGEAVATNVPHYQHLWNFTANILYGPKNASIMLIDEAFNVGSLVQCFADSNPAPNYEWEIVGRNVSLKTGSVLQITESMVSHEEQTLQCTAVNYVTGEIRRNISETFKFNLTGFTTQWNGSSGSKFYPLLIIGISVGALIFCLAIAMIICKIRRKDGTSNRPDVALNTDLNSNGWSQFSI